MDAILRLPAEALLALEVVVEAAPGQPALQVSFADGALRARPGTLNEVQGELAGGRDGAFVWADVQTGGEWGACEALLDALGVAPLDEGAERIEQAPDHVAAVVRELDSEGALHVFRFPSALLTLHRAPSPAVAGALQAGRALGGRWQSDTALALLVAASLAPVAGPVRQALAEGAALEQLVRTLSERDEGDLLLRMSTAQARVARLKAFCVSKRVLLDDLAAAKRPLGPAMHAFLRHVGVRHRFHTQALTLAAARLADQGAAYLGRVQVDVALSNDKTNGIVRVLTVVSTITLPLLFGQGLFSMNIDLPGRQVQSNIDWWLAILAVCTAAVIAALLFMRYVIRWF